MGTLALLTIASIFFLNAPLSTFFVMRPCEEAGYSKPTVIYIDRLIPSPYLLIREDDQFGVLLLMEISQFGRHSITPELPIGRINREDLA